MAHLLWSSAHLLRAADLCRPRPRSRRSPTSLTLNASLCWSNLGLFYSLSSSSSSPSYWVCDNTLLQVRYSAHHSHIFSCVLISSAPVSNSDQSFCDPYPYQRISPILARHPLGHISLSSRFDVIFLGYTTRILTPNTISTSRLAAAVGCTSPRSGNPL